MASADRCLELVGEAGNGAEALRQFGKLKPDVTLLDSRLPDIDGYELLRQLLVRSPATRVIIFSANSMEHEAMNARELGAVGFLKKDVEIDQLREAIFAVNDGRTSWPKPVSSSKKSSISSREMAVLHCLARGHTNKDIALALEISFETVKTHVKSLLLKLEAADRTEAVARAYQLGLVQG